MPKSRDTTRALSAALRGQARRQPVQHRVSRKRVRRHIKRPVPPSARFINLHKFFIRVPRGQLLTSRDEAVEVRAPAVVKPNAQGSTIGLSFVDRDEDLAQAVAKAFQYDSAVLVEEWVRGMETSVPVLGDRALPPVEIAPVSGRYDFASKYSVGATEEIIPARLPEAVLGRLQEWALKAHRALGCAGATRTDIIVNGDDLVALETNTLPGMTGTSLLPNSAAAAGIPYADLVDWMVQDALRRHAEKTQA